jgi:hypothetical protein
LEIIIVASSARRTGFEIAFIGDGRPLTYTIKRRG